jgi:TPR repeat protein
MARSVLGVAHSARRSARSAAETAGRGVRAVAADPRGLVALGFLGAATAAAATGALVVGAQKLYPYVLYTPECDNQSTLEKARALDAKDDAANTQAHFDELQEKWTLAAALYLEAGKGICPAAQYALGRLCCEGRGYVYDPEFGANLYGRAAASGNADAQYALACIALREALDASSAHGDSLRESLYTASSLLLLARNNKSTLKMLTAYALAVKHARETHATEYKGKYFDRNGQKALHLAVAVRAAAEFNLAAGDPQTWAKNTETFLLVAAATSDDAKAQALNHDPTAVLAREWKGNGGWRADLAQCADIHKPMVLELASALVSATLAKQETADPREAVLVARLFLPTDGDTRERKRALAGNGELTAKAKELVEYAAKKGDEVALMMKVVQKAGEFPDGVIPVGPAMTAILGLLHETCDASLIETRGTIHHYKKNTDEAKKDWEKAAALGNESAMQLCRMSGRITGTEVIYHGVSVSPIAAALEITVTSATPVLTNEASGSDLVVWNYIGLAQAPSEPEAGTARAVKGAIHVAWPNLGKKKNGSDALHALEDTYAKIVAEFARGKSDDTWHLLVQPIPKQFFGKFAEDAPVMTARAILRAISEMRKVRYGFDLRVTISVFDTMSVVCEYDRALQACIRASPPRNAAHRREDLPASEEVTDVRAFIKAPRTARVALILGCGKQPGGSLSNDGWRVDLVKATPQTQEEIAVSEWLKLESEDNKERVRVFRATIAAARDSPNSLVTVRCEKPLITFVFARFEGECVNPHLEADLRVHSALLEIRRTGEKYESVHVSIASFAERVAESERVSFEANLRSIPSEPPSI